MVEDEKCVKEFHKRSSMEELGVKCDFDKEKNDSCLQDNLVVSE